MWDERIRPYIHADLLLGIKQKRFHVASRDAAMDLIYDRRREGYDPLTHFVNLFPDDASGAAAAPASKGVYDDLTLEEKLKRHIIDGEKRHLVEHLEEALKTYKPLDIINNILLEGMKGGMFTGVGLPRCFNDAVDDPVNARRIVNGTDHAADIAAIHAGFLAGLS